MRASGSEAASFVFWGSVPIALTTKAQRYAEGLPHIAKVIRNEYL